MFFYRFFTSRSLGSGPAVRLPDFRLNVPNLCLSLSAALTVDENNQSSSIHFWAVAEDSWERAYTKNVAHSVPDQTVQTPPDSKSIAGPCE